MSNWTIYPILDVLEHIKHVIKSAKLEKLAEKKAEEIHVKTIDEAMKNREIYDRTTLVRISLLVCEIEKSYELSLVEISKHCNIKYQKPDPEIFYNLVLEKIRGFARKY